MKKDLLQKAKPFLKWAGGKTQLIKEIEALLPGYILQQKSFTFLEPFVGGGAVLFWMLTQYPNLEKAVINDINSDLINCYLTIQNNVQELIPILKKWESTYHKVDLDIAQKKIIYYKKRTLFNQRTSDSTTQAALFIFLNRTCFNGLYRVNGKNEFNVPIGGYKKPQICNASNLIAVSKVLEKVVILNGDYIKTLDHATHTSFFYFDPPYKPLTNTASFNAYAKGGFDDTEQVRLSLFCNKIHQQKHQWLLSNSDVKSVDPENYFFDNLYKNYTIKRISARRNINSIGAKRGRVSELLIHNTKSSENS